MNSLVIRRHHYTDDAAHLSTTLAACVYSVSRGRTPLLRDPSPRAPMSRPPTNVFSDRGADWPRSMCVPRKAGGLHIPSRPSPRPLWPATQGLQLRLADGETHLIGLFYDDGFVDTRWRAAEACTHSGHTGLRFLQNHTLVPVMGKRSIVGR